MENKISAEKIILLHKNYLKHFEARRQYYWNRRSQRLYDRYTELIALLEDIDCHIKYGDTER